MKRKVIARAIGRILKKFRNSAGVSQYNLSKMLNITYQQIGNYERGESMPTMARIHDIAKYLNTDCRDMIEAISDAIHEDVKEWENIHGIPLETGEDPFRDMLEEDNTDDKK